MSRNIYFFKTCLFIAVFSVILPAHALESLLFNQSVSTRTTRLISNFTQTHPEIAKTDLNEDGIDEFIVRKATCAGAEIFCTHQILAENNDVIVELGRIHAKYLMLGNDYRHGIRNILAFKNKSNDYEYDVYVWEPDRSQYILLE